MSDPTKNDNNNNKHYDVGQEQPQQQEHTTPAVMIGSEYDDLDDEIIQDHRAPLCTRNRMRCGTWTSIVVALVCLCIVVPAVVVTGRKTAQELAALQDSLNMLGNEWIPLGNQLSSTDGEEFGESVALSANGLRLAIGANEAGDDNEGAVTIKRFEGSYWQSIGDIKGGRAGLNFGHAVQLSADGNTVLASGFATNETKGLVQSYEYHEDKYEWVQVGGDVMSPSLGDRFGISLSMNAAGNAFVVGADGHDDDVMRNGAAFVYQRSSATGEWTRKGKAFMGNNGSRMGYAVAMSGDGDTICVGERDYKLEVSGNQRGQVVCHYWNGVEWIVKGRNRLRGRRNGGNFGYSLALNYAGTRVAVGNRLGNANDSGTMLVFELQGSNGEWTVMGDEITSGEGDDQGGFQCDLNAKGDVLAWTARGYDNNQKKNVGIVRTAQWRNGEWVELGEGISGEMAGDSFGESVALNEDGTIFAASSNWNNDKEYVMVFRNEGSNNNKKKKKRLLLRR